MADIDWQIDPGRGLGVVRLGLRRDEVLRRLAEAGFEVEDDDLDPDWYYVDDLDAELKFGAGTDPVLDEIFVCDEDVRFGPVKLIDEPIHKILELLKVANDETAWTLRSDLYKNEAKSESGVANADSTTPTDKQLFTDGTLWLRPFGLGLDLVYGDVTGVRIRRPNDLKQRMYGTLTDVQRTFAAKPDLSSRLIESGTQTSMRTGAFAKLSLLAAVIAMGIVIWQGIDYQRRWNAATKVPGEVLELDPPPPQPFPERITVAYRDTAGAPHQVVFALNDLYATPKVGEQVEVRFLPEAPDEPMGPAKVNDAAFSKFVPWGIGVMATYCVLQLVVPLLGMVLSSRKRSSVS